MAKNQVQNAVDAAALAGSRQLGENYDTNVSPPDTNVDSVAQATAQANKAVGKQVEVALENIEVGVWGTEACPAPCGEPAKLIPHFYIPVNNIFPNAVRVTTNTTFDSFFARIFGKSALGTGATAIAALFGPCPIIPETPLGISTGWFALNPGTGFCGTSISLNASPTSCAGWTNFEPPTGKYRKDDVRCMLECMASNTSTECQKCNDSKQNYMTEIPTDPINSSGIEFGGGNADIMPAFAKVWDKYRKLDGDGDDNIWTTSVLVYDLDCSNPNKDYPIVGKATVKISMVTPPADMLATVACGEGEDNKGNCFNYGTVGKYPRLVGKTEWPGF
jgi:hypothetical protein